jgi:hypothetical protein
MALIHIFVTFNAFTVWLSLSPAVIIESNNDIAQNLMKECKVVIVS